jgi:hypothetical protein
MKVDEILRIKKRVAREYASLMNGLNNPHEYNDTAHRVAGQKACSCSTEDQKRNHAHISEENIM